MTRFARAGRKKFLEASNWEDLSADQANAETVNQNDKAPLQEKSKKNHSKGKKGSAQKRNATEETVLDPKRQKRIEARRLRRKKRKCCFVCRQYGHQALECPNKNDMKIGHCFKCGSTDHTTKNCKAVNTDEKSSGPFPFAKCFICQEMGHLARTCPENPRGLYPQGGGCKICGSVEHLKRDCPRLLKRKIEGHASVNLTVTEAHASADAEDNIETDVPKPKKKLKEKVIKF